MKAREVRSAAARSRRVCAHGIVGVVKREFRDYSGGPKFSVGPADAVEPCVQDERFVHAHAWEINLI